MNIPGSQKPKALNPSQNAVNPLNIYIDVRFSLPE